MLAASRRFMRLGPVAWNSAAPDRLPKPTTAIFARPLSAGPWNCVCGLTRLTGRITSAAAAWRSR